MLNRIVPMMVVLSAAMAVPAWPCSLMRPVPPPEDLVRQADVIVRARVEGLADPGPPEMFSGEEGRRLRFQVLEVLKGELLPDSLSLIGMLEDRDDPNEIPVPYTFVRPGGRRGNCYAFGYRRGAEYLLMLRPSVRGRSHGKEGELTPYWAPLSPINEQLARGADDPWLAWVRKQIRD